MLPLIEMLIHIEELLPAVFDIFRESDPVADCQRDLLSLEHTELPSLTEWQLLVVAVLSDDCSSLGHLLDDLPDGNGDGISRSLQILRTIKS